MNILRERVLFILSATGLVIFIASFLVSIFQVSGFASPVVLHFDNARGIDLYGERGDVWVIWATSLAVFIANAILANIFYFRERSFSYVLIGFNFLWAILALVFAGVVTSVN